MRAASLPVASDEPSDRASATSLSSACPCLGTTVVHEVPDDRVVDTGLPDANAVWRAPPTVTSTADPSSLVSPFAHASGVAGSFRASRARAAAARSARAARRPAATATGQNAHGERVVHDGTPEARRPSPRPTSSILRRPSTPPTGGTVDAPDREERLLEVVVAARRSSGRCSRRRRPTRSAAVAVLRGGERRRRASASCPSRSRGAR